MRTTSTPLYWLSLILVIAGLALVGCELQPEPEEPPEAIPEPPTIEVPEITLHEAALNNDIETLQRYAQLGTDWNAVDTEGFSPLYWAVSANNQETILYLLDQGANPNQADSFGTRPLHLAASDNYQHVARLLIQAGADINAPDNNGYTPAQVALFMNQEDMVAFLVEAGAQPPVMEEPDETEHTQPALVEFDIAPPIQETGDFRTWTSSKNDKIDAEFVEITLDMVVLRTRDNQMLRVPIQHLRSADQILARELASSARPPMPSRVTPPTRDRSTSIALRIGKGDGWTVLNDCRLLRNSSNDGDSFHVRHEGTEYIFRLYYVDAAETDMRFPERIRDQANYFKLTDKQTLRLGEDATRFMQRTLSGRSFTVVTRWADARGSSRLPRYFAFIVTDQGDFDELLTAEGLVRVYGMQVPSSLGRSKRRQLERLEQNAKHERRGAWGIK